MNKSVLTLRCYLVGRVAAGAVAPSLTQFRAHDIDLSAPSHRNLMTALTNIFSNLPPISFIPFPLRLFSHLCTRLCRIFISYQLYYTARMAPSSVASDDSN